MNEIDAFDWAIEAARQSPCAKSKRGVVIFNRDRRTPIGSGRNGPPPGFLCDKSNACRAACRQVCVHAEQMAILDVCVNPRRNRPGAELLGQGAEMLHIEFKNGQPVACSGPSCVECSKIILAAGISKVWLFEKSPSYPEGGLIWYTAEKFHATTLQSLGLPILRDDQYAPNKAEGGRSNRRIAKEWHVRNDNKPNAVLSDNALSNRPVSSDPFLDGIIARTKE